MKTIIKLHGYAVSMLLGAAVGAWVDNTDRNALIIMIIALITLWSRQILVDYQATGPTGPTEDKPTEGQGCVA